MTEKDHLTLKFAVLGDKQVGKTSLVQRFTTGNFNSVYIHTKGGDIVEKVIHINGISIHLTIIDSAGHDYVRSLIKSLYRNVHGIMLVYDVTREATFAATDEWLRQISLVNTSDPVLLLVGNKNDMARHRQVNTQQAQMYAVNHNIAHLEASAKRDFHVSEAFDTLIRETFKVKLPNYIKEGGTNIKLNTNDQEDNEPNPCC